MSELQPPNGDRGDPLHVEVVSRDPAVPLAFVLKVFIIGIAVAVLIPLGATILINNNQTNHRLAENRNLTEQNGKLLDQNKQLTKRLAEFTAEVCLAGERRDTAQVKSNNAIIRVLRLFPDDNPKLLALITSLQDQNSILEPKGEPDCSAPPGVSP